MVENNRLKKAIKFIKLEYNLEQQAMISEKLGIGSTYFSELINGKYPLSEKNSKKIESVFGISSDWLLTGKGEMLRQNLVKEGNVSVTAGGDANNVVGLNNIGNIAGDGVNNGNFVNGDNNVVNPNDFHLLVKTINDKDYIIAQLRKKLEQINSSFSEKYNELNLSYISKMGEMDKRYQDIVHNSYERNKENQRRLDEKDVLISNNEKKIRELYDKVIELNDKIFELASKKSK